jgi:hypothetical protein
VLLAKSTREQRAAARGAGAVAPFDLGYGVYIGHEQLVRAFETHS